MNWSKSMGDDDFIVKLLGAIKKGENVPMKKAYWISDTKRNRFLRKYGFRHGSNNKTLYSRSGYLAQLVPALEMTHALRYICKIKGGEGRIWNADESLTARYEHKTKGWGVI